MATPRTLAPENWDMRSKVWVEKRPCPRETRKLSNVNHAKQPSETPVTQAPLLGQVSSIHSCEMNMAENVIQNNSTPGLPRQRTRPVQKAVCGCSRCSTVSMLRVVAGRECANRYFTPRKSIKRKLTSSMVSFLLMLFLGVKYLLAHSLPRKSIKRKLTSSMVALIHRESNKLVKPANAMAQ